MKPSLKISLGTQNLESPLILASGILGTKAELLARVAQTGLGAVTTKSCGLQPRQGHENPTVLAWEHGLINAVGLTNPGVEKEVEEIKTLKNLLKKKSLKTKIIASFFGSTFEEFVKVGKILQKAQPDFMEANVSCPNCEAEFGCPFGASKANTYKLIKKLKKIIKIPLIVKFSAIVDNIKANALAAQEAGADVISSTNTLNSMVIDLESGKPILTNKMGGISGPALKPIGIGCVYQMSSVCKIPVIGLGGITTGNDAVEMIMAGATAVGIGSAVYYRGLNVFKKINQEIKAFMKKKKYQTIKDFKGMAHEKN